MNENNDKWINVDPRTEKLSLRFRVRGFTRQFYLSTGLKNSVNNRNILKAKIELIERDIALDRFDATLQSYRFGVTNSETEQCISLYDLWEKFTQFKSHYLEKTTIKTSYRNTSNIISKIPHHTLDEAPIIRDFLLKNYSYHTAYTTINYLSSCCEWAITESILRSNPFEKLRLPKPKKKSSDDEIAVYTLEQRDIIIQAFDEHPRYSYYANLIRFLFWTGCRPGEAFALTWGDINNHCLEINISKSYASKGRETKGTKNGKRRTFLCSSGGKLHQLLLKIIPSQPNPKELIFKSITGLPMTSKILDKAWRGHHTQDYHYSGVVKKLAEQGKVPYLKLYSTRHTFATWAIASGVSPDRVAYLLGDDVSTVLKYYCHPEATRRECPDF